ncbi:hypothetical protein lerEdw1_019117 [Lerista edwardsae]|nr:hypothetical protein lerEdw1_019117 [Lerista edwardsae]
MHRCLGQRLNIQSGCNLFREVQCYLQTPGVPGLADQIPRLEGDCHDLVPVLRHHDAVPHLQHVASLHHTPEQHCKHVPPQVAKRSDPTVLVNLREQESLTISLLLHQRYIFQLLILFLIPGIVMMIAYGLISLELYRGIKFDVSQRKSSRAHEKGKLAPAVANTKMAMAATCKKNKKKKMPLQQLSANKSSTKTERPRSSCSTANLMAKKLVIRMLIVIVILFFICWTPIFSANTWRAFDPETANKLTGAPISFIHLLSYMSACVNPIIYCFMNKRFRMGFLATFTCCAKQKLPVVRAEMAEDEEGKTTGASLSRYSYMHMNAPAPT